MKNIFDQNDTNHFIKRINALTEDSFPKWGVMSVDKMLAHCNVTYELIYEQEKHKKPNRLMKWVLTRFVKPKVVNETPYKHNSPTAAMFVITDDKSFEEEKRELSDSSRKRNNWVQKPSKEKRVLTSESSRLPNGTI
jgi:hypothetical protein